MQRRGQHLCRYRSAVSITVLTAGCTRLRPPMARRSLRPHLNQIRSWVRQGRTDAWIAHQLEVTVQQIEAFKRENELAPQDEGAAYEEEVDHRAEDDALVAAELEAAAAAEPEDEDAEEA